MMLFIWWAPFDIRGGGAENVFEWGFPFFQTQISLHLKLFYLVSFYLNALMKSSMYVSVKPKEIVNGCPVKTNKKVTYLTYLIAGIISI